RRVSRGTPGIGCWADITPTGSWAKSALAAHDILVGRELDQADRTAGVHSVGRDADFRAQAELAAIGELRAGIVHDDGAVDFPQEPLGGGGVAGDDRFGVLAAEAGDVTYGASHAVDCGDADDRLQIFGAPILLCGRPRPRVALLHFAIAA